MPTMQRDLRRWGPTLATLAGAAAICATVVITRPSSDSGTWIDNDSLAATAKASAETALRLERIEGELDLVKTEARRSRCELQRLNSRIGGGSGVSFDPSC